MSKLTVALLVLSLSTAGCAMNLGKFSPTECKGISVSFGSTVGPCGLEGGEISLPAASLVGGIAKAAGDLVKGLFAPEPVVIEHRTVSAAAEPEPEPNDS